MSQPQIKSPLEWYSDQLETLKAQLAESQAQVEQLCGDCKTIQHDYTDAHQAQLRAEAQVRELREADLILFWALREIRDNGDCLCPCDSADCCTEVGEHCPTCNATKALKKYKAALRSAPPGAQDSALTADVAQSTPDRSPSRGVTGKEHLATNQEVAALGKQPSAVSAETNAGEERKDLARQALCGDGVLETEEVPAAAPHAEGDYVQSSDAENVNHAASKADARSHRGGAASEQVPAAECHEQDTPANPSRLGTEPQDSPSRSQRFNVTVSHSSMTWPFGELVEHLQDCCGGCPYCIELCNHAVIEASPDPPSPAREKEKAE